MGLKTLFNPLLKKGLDLVNQQEAPTPPYASEIINDSGVVGSTVKDALNRLDAEMPAMTEGALPFGEAVTGNLTQDATNLKWYSGASKYLQILTGIKIGLVDAFGRTQIWNNLVNSVLRLGSLGQDGDPTDSTSEGVVIYGKDANGAPISSALGNFGYARIKADRFGLYTSILNVAGYIFRVDLTSLYLAKNDLTKTFEVTRSSGNVTALGNITGANLSGTNTGDQTASTVSNTSGVAGTMVSDALNTLNSGKVNFNKITVVNPIAGTKAEFTTLQAAFDSIPAATDALSARQVYSVYVPSGTYDEDVVVQSNNRRIVMVCMGSVALGVLSGSSWGTGGTARNFTIFNNGTATINSIRSAFAITSICPNSDGHTSHQSYISKFRISGNLVLSANIGISSEFFLECEVFGNLDTSAYSGNCNVYLKNSRIRGTCGGTTLRLQSATNCNFGGLVTCTTYSLISGSVFALGMTTSSGPSEVNPNGFINTNFSGTFTGPALSLKLDAVTNYWFKLNGATLAGGATKVYMFVMAKAWQYTVTAADVLNKYITLPRTPEIPEDNGLDFIGGGPQEYTTDFIISGNQLSWNGRGLDGVIAEGDKLRVLLNT